MLRYAFNKLFALIKFAFIALSLFLILVLIFLILIFVRNGYSYDKNKPTEFFKIKEGWRDEAHTIKRESFVLSNPPNDSALLKKIVEEYNLRTMSVDTIKKYFRYERVFYRETGCLTRDFEQGKPYPDDCSHHDIGDGQQTGYYYFKEENLIETYYCSFNDGSTYYNYSFGRHFKDTDIKEIKIKDIDQFFEEGRKKLNLDSTGKLLY